MPNNIVITKPTLPHYPLLSEDEVRTILLAFIDCRYSSNPSPDWFRFDRLSNVNGYWIATYVSECGNFMTTRDYGKVKGYKGKYKLR